MTPRKLIVAGKPKASTAQCLPIMPSSAPTDLPSEISEIIARILCDNERAFCIISNEYHEGGHPLPIYRVDENGKGVECGRADVLVVKDGIIIALMEGSLVEAPNNLERGCLYYEFKGAKDSMEKGPYEFARDCVVFTIFSAAI